MCICISMLRIRNKLEDKLNGLFYVRSEKGIKFNVELINSIKVLQNGRPSLTFTGYSVQ